MQNNLHKVKRVLEKTNFAESFDQAELEAGNSTVFLKIIHHLFFRASESFTQFIDANAHKDLKFMPDPAFFKNTILILCDLFGYRTELTPQQFFDKGYGERKMVLVLSIYDILKKTRKGLKINHQLTRVEAGAPHASDESRKEYQVINHKNHVAKNVLIKINTTTEKRTLTV